MGFVMPWATPAPMPTLDRRPTHKALPLLRSEVSRITHRRLFRVFAVLFLLGIVAISTIVFFAHQKSPETMDSATLERQIERLELMAQAGASTLAGLD